MHVCVCVCLSASPYLFLSLAYSLRISVSLSSPEPSRACCGPLAPLPHPPDWIPCHSIPGSPALHRQAAEESGAPQGMSLQDPVLPEAAESACHAPPAACCVQGLWSADQLGDSPVSPH